MTSLWERWAKQMQFVRAESGPLEFGACFLGGLLYMVYCVESECRLGWLPHVWESP